MHGAAFLPLSFAIAVSRVLCGQVADTEAKLPGPAIDIPIDVDGDGQDSYGDRYFLNWWLEQGGDLDLAFSSIKAEGKIIDLSAFFASSDAQLLASAPESFAPSGGGAAILATNCPQPGDAPNHTRRIPPDRVPAAASFHPRATPGDSRFIVFSSAASNLPGALGGKRQIYRFEQSTSTTSANIVLISPPPVVANPPNPPQDCDEPSISNDGTRIVFKTTAKLTADDVDGVSDIYLRDLTDPLNPKTTRLTAPQVAGVRGSGSFGASIAGARNAGGGGFVAFTSASSDLADGDLNGSTLDVFRVEINPDGTEGPIDLVSVAEVSFFPSLLRVQSTSPMSTVGDIISTVCPNLPIASPGSGCPAPQPTGCPSLTTGLNVGRVISDDGMRIVMHGAPCDWSHCAPPSVANTFLCPDPEECSCAGDVIVCAHPIQQVYVRDLSLPFNMFKTQMVSKIPKIVNGDDGCFPANGCCRRGSISGDGSRVSFSTNATNFNFNDCDASCCDADCFEDVYFVDVNPVFNPGNCPVPNKVSVPLCGGGFGVAANGHSFQPIPSTDGMFIVYTSNATNLLLCNVDTNALRDIFVRKLSIPTSTVRRSVDSAGAQATGGTSFNPDISSDGMVAVFESAATNLIGPPPADNNGVQDIFQNFSPQGTFIRGDVDLNGKIDLTDAIRILNWLSSGGPPPGCYDAADANDSGAIDIADSPYLLAFLFQGGAPPPCPFCCAASPPFTSCCGKDPTGDGLPCGVTLSGCTAFSSVDGSCPPH